jgi:hypothetical protein
MLIFLKIFLAQFRLIMHNLNILKNYDTKSKSFLFFMTCTINWYLSTNVFLLIEMYGLWDPFIKTQTYYTSYQESLERKGCYNIVNETFSFVFLILRLPGFICKSVFSSK